jgi:hypothetical protein
MKSATAILASTLALYGCVDIDPQQLNRALAQAYAINQATTQRQVDALNASSAALARRLPVAPTPIADFDWDWDLQSNVRGEPIWVCRGVQTGEYAEVSRCAFKLQTDLRWPGR